MAVGSLGEEHRDMIEKVRDTVDSRQVKVYQVATGVGKGEHYIVGLDLEGERIIGLKILGLDV